MCLGAVGGQRGLDALERELVGPEPRGRAAAALGLARAGALERLRALSAEERDPWVRGIAARALEGACDQRAFRLLDPASARVS